MAREPCARCRPALAPPAAAAPVQTLLLHSRAPTALPKLRCLLAAEGLAAVEPLPNALAITAPTASLERVVRAWREALTADETRETRGVFLVTLPSSAEGLAQALLEMVGLEHLLAQRASHWLPRVLGQEALYMVFQPLFSLRERRAVAFEALMRARDGDRELGAGLLLSAARAAGHVQWLDQVARRTAVRQARPILHAGHQLFINFTPSAIYDPRHCLRDTLATCQQVGAHLGQLVFEVIEAEQVHDLAHLRAILDEYRANGARVALDDLGSGYSSMLHLAELRPDYVKLDSGLVRNASRDRVRGVLLRALAEAAHALEIQVVAEGVETAEDLAFCREIGADLVQGYYLARPAPSPEVPAEALRRLAALG